VPTTRAFTCEDGSNLTVTFYPPPSHARVVQQGYAPIDLPTEITGSGYRYAQGGAELRGSFGQQARWTRPGAGLTLCDEAHQP
jgi:membrane-bound inhibitor of C-type lysozyme